jgi:hypothetical protein
VETRGRPRLADAVGRPEAWAPVLLDGQRWARQRWQQARRQESVRRLHGGARREDREAPVALPDGSSRHLGLRRPEPDRSLRREDRRQAAPRDRRGFEDGVALPRRPNEREATPSDPGEACATEREPEDVADPADPELPALRPARAERPAVHAGAEAAAAGSRPPGAGDPGEDDVHALLEDPGRLHAGPAGRHQLAALELQPADADVLRLRPERPGGVHGRNREACEGEGGRSGQDDPLAAR